MSRTAVIKVTVDLDDGNLPTRIAWEATDASDGNVQPCQSMMLSLWNSETKTAAAIDLWTRDATIEDMSLHFYEAFHKMADTWLRATRNAELAKLIHEFADGFGERLGLTRRPTRSDGGGSP
jgi:gliding motility-associated protein GldC